MPKIKINEEEHRLIIRYREQARAFNEGVAAALAVLGLLEQNEGSEDFYARAVTEVAKLRKDTP